MAKRIKAWSTKKCPRGCVDARLLEQMENTVSLDYSPQREENLTQHAFRARHALGLDGLSGLGFTEAEHKEHARWAMKFAKEEIAHIEAGDCNADRFKEAFFKLGAAQGHNEAGDYPLFHEPAWYAEHVRDLLNKCRLYRK